MHTRVLVCVDVFIHVCSHADSPVMRIALPWHASRGPCANQPISLPDQNMLVKSDYVSPSIINK